MDISTQIVRGHATVQNIERQYNSFPPGSAFVKASQCKEGKQYELKKGRLYYRPQDLEKILSSIQTEHSILIPGEQGSGKTMLAFEIAEQMQQQKLVSAVYYLNTPSNWNTIKQWVQAIHFQDRLSNSKETHLWIVDNLHRVPGTVEDFPDTSFWEDDYCICCTRSLDGLPSKHRGEFDLGLTSDQVFLRSIDQKTFLECYNAWATYKVGRSESDRLYQYIGGNLALLEYIIIGEKLPLTDADWQNGHPVDFQHIYDNYFKGGSRSRITSNNRDDTLNMLFLSQLDFPIPIHMQGDTCNNVLKDLYFETANQGLEIEHASLAELLTASICAVHKRDTYKAFSNCLHWTLENLVDDDLDQSEQIRLINDFLRSLFDCKFVLKQEEPLRKILSEDKCLIEFLEKNASVIACSTWKSILKRVNTDSETNDIFRRFAISHRFIESLQLNHEYDFRYFQSKLPLEDLHAMERLLLLHVERLMQFKTSVDAEKHFTHLLSSLSGEAAVEFLAQISSDDLKQMLSNSASGLFIFARCFGLLENKVQGVLENKLSTDDYRQLFINRGSVTGFINLLVVASDSLREKLCGLLTVDLADSLIQNTIANNFSIGTVGINLRRLKNKSGETLVAFENTLGISGYKRLLQAQGTIPILADLIKYSSDDMRQKLSEMLQTHPQLLENLLARTIQNKSSIGALSLTLRDLKKNSEETLAAFENALGISGYKRLLQAQGTIPILASLINYSSDDMRQKLSEMLQTHPQLVENLLARTIQNKSSIGTLGLNLRDLKKNSEETLAAFENALDVSGYQKLLETNGTISTLTKLMENSSDDMRHQLSEMLQSHPQLVENLLARTIQNKSSIGTLGLTLRDLKKNSEETLATFENALGISGYKRLLQAQGTIPILASLIKYSSNDMRQKLSEMLQTHPQLVENLLARTIQNKSSIETLGLTLRILKKNSKEILKVFEKSLGVNGYERLLQAQGTISALTDIILCSSANMQTELAKMLRSHPELVTIALENTVRKGSHIGMLSVTLRKLDREAPSCLQIIEDLIGTDGYLSIFSKCGETPITILRIMACSSLSDSLVDRIYENTDLWIRSKDGMQNSCLLLCRFNDDLLYAEKKGRIKFFDALKDLVSPEEWIAWMRQGATLQEAILTVKNLPWDTAQAIADLWLRDYHAVIQDFRSVMQERKQEDCPALNAVYFGLRKMQNLNQQLAILLSEEYGKWV